MDAAEAELAEAANRLYWSSNRSVNRIADDLGLSKGTLYGLITPIDAGEACPECGEGLTHANRTAREKAVADCPSCAGEGPVTTIPPRPHPVQHTPEPIAAEQTPRRSVATSGRVLVGTALLAVAAGLLIYRVTRRS